EICDPGAATDGRPYRLFFNGSVAEPRQLIEAVKRGGLVALREGGIVENRIDEVLNGALESKDSLSDVKQLRRTFSDYVNTQKLLCLTMEYQLEAAGRVATNLTARDFTIIGNADFVRHVVFC